ncbi:protein CPR-5 [Iris pallida]|uniref:Protein CPR-5 n=1 Tax=Iris pallida TaxID=29817 RepID=A0AAX6F361_IRIPA|nr:protein CPR-5 [Iris pallida]
MIVGPGPAPAAYPAATRSPDSSPNSDVNKVGVFNIDTSPPPSSASSSHVSFRRHRRKKQHQKQGKGVLVGSRPRWVPGGRRGGGLQDLALPLGMSFAAVLSQVLDGRKGSSDDLPVDQLSLICTSAVKESVSNIYGNRFDSFLLNFENSFHSTLKTLWLINGTSVTGKRSRAHRQVSIGQRPKRSVNEISIRDQENIDCSSFRSTSNFEAVEENCVASNATIEDFPENTLLTSMNNQLMLHGQQSQELAQVSHSFVNPGFGQAIFNTLEKSLMQQSRSNDLKEFEIGLISKKLQLKQSQLALNSYANMLERVKISMGICKATFKEQKLRNQMLDTRHAELLQRCIDLLVGGLFIMSGFLIYGAYVFSYERITEATSSCSAIPKESRSWWIPKPVASLNSVWLVLSCHVTALSRMLFGLVMIVAVAIAVFQRSVKSGPTVVPVTFNLLILGLLCGFFGKLCIDTLGGSGFYWLLLWEPFCLVHFFANVFPSALHYVLYGPLSISQGGARAGTLLPYWLRRSVFYVVLSFVYPAMSGLLPFASLGIWKEHFTEKIYLWNAGVEGEL